MTPVSPVALAREMGINPPTIYRLIKNGKVRGYQGTRGQEVDPEEVKRVLGATGGRPRPPRAKPGSPPRGHAKATVGAILSWDKQPNRGGRPYRGRRIAQITEVSRSGLTYLSDGRDHCLFFGTADLRAHFEKGEVVLENPWALLKMIIRQWEIESPEACERAASLGLWMLENMPEGTDVGDAISQWGCNGDHSHS